MTTKYLKKENLPTLVLCLAWNIALFIVFLNGTDDFWNTLRERISQLRGRDSLFLALTPLILTIASGILPASWKASLVFWRFRYALPGCRAFSNLAKFDPRIDGQRLLSKLDPLPNTPHEQNAVWYRWYKAVQDQMTVQEAHKQFLLNRDITGISFLFLALGTLSLAFSQTPAIRVWTYGGVALAQYVAFALVARNHGNRFVCNVITEYLNKK